MFYVCASCMCFMYVQLRSIHVHISRIYEQPETVCLKRRLQFLQNFAHNFSHLVITTIYQTCLAAVKEEKV